MQTLPQSFNSKDLFFGTNPICFGAPRAHEEPFCVDMVPTYPPWNKILDYKEKGLKLENNIAIDSGNQQLILKARALLQLQDIKVMP